MKIYLGGHNASVPLHNASASKITGTEISLINTFLEAKFEICDHLSDAEALVLIDMDINLLQAARKLLDGKLPIIFIRNEPIIVWPANYNSKAISLTSKLIDVGRPRGITKSDFPYPQDWNQNLEFKEVVSTRSEKIILINGNKLSFIKGEMYSCRRECIFDLPNLDLFGIGWDISFFRKLLIFLAEFRLAIVNGLWPRMSNTRRWIRRPTNWKGAPESKLATLSIYKYNLVIENSMDAMTEKLFDSFFARCIPVYVGPAVHEFDIPESLVVQVDPNLSSIKTGLAVAQEMDYEAWKSRLNDWLGQDAVFNKWSAAKAYEAIVAEASHCIEKYQK